MTGRSRSDRPLVGRRILLTRPSGSGREWVDRLERLGAEVEWRPAIAFEAPDDREAVHRACENLASYDWLLFTSANGVRFFHSALQAASTGWDAFQGSISAIGPGTAKALGAVGQRVQIVAGTSRAEGLLQSLHGKIEPAHRILLVRPEEARSLIPDTLIGAGLAVDVVAFYRTVPAADLSSTVADLESGRFDVAVFASPSAFRCLRSCAMGRFGTGRDALGRTSLVAIGEVTAAEIRGSGYEPAAVAVAPTGRGLEGAILAILANPSGGPRNTN